MFYRVLLRSQYSEFLHLFAVQYSLVDKFFRPFLFYRTSLHQEYWSEITIVPPLSDAWGKFAYTQMDILVFIFRWLHGSCKLYQNSWPMIALSAKLQYYRFTYRHSLHIYASFYMNKCNLQNITAAFQKPAQWIYDKMPYFRASHAIIVTI